MATKQSKLHLSTVGGSPESVAPKTWPLESLDENNRAVEGRERSGSSRMSPRTHGPCWEKQGHLWKWTNYLKGWQRRFFILEMVFFHTTKKGILEP
eukprot:jgi/Galph1/2466/GphlegSOOS_G1135.1